MGSILIRLRWAALALLAHGNVAQAQPDPAAINPLDDPDYSALSRQAADLNRHSKLNESYTIYNQALRIELEKFATDPANPLTLHAADLILLDLGDILQRQGDLDAAMRDFRAVENLSAHLRKAVPANQLLLRDAGVAMLQLAKLPDAKINPADVQAYWQELNKQHLLQAEDQHYVTEALALGSASMPRAVKTLKSSRGLKNPSWIRTPSAEDISEILQKITTHDATAGYILLRCRVRIDTTLTDCATLEESPKNHGLGTAMLKLTESLRMTPMTIDGAATDFGIVYIPLRINFNSSY